MVEDKILAGLQEAAERQVAAGTGVLATVGVNESLALGHYFLFGTGRWVAVPLAARGWRGGRRGAGARP